MLWSYHEPLAEPWFHLEGNNETQGITALLTRSVCGDYELYRKGLLPNLLEAKSGSVDSSLQKNQDDTFTRDAPEDLSEDSELAKYWNQRYRFFSRFAEGIRMDREAWFSVTPELIAAHIAQRFKRMSAKRDSLTVLDGFCGVGGNTIQLAFVCKFVVAIDIDPNKIELARHNAKVYGVADRIKFICGDFFSITEDLLETGLAVDGVFLSPPWGGPKYLNKKKFDLKTGIPCNGIKTFECARKLSENIAYYLPRNVNTDEVVSLASPGGFMEIEENILIKKLKSITAYYGNLVAYGVKF